MVCPLVRNMWSTMVYITNLSTYISVGHGHYEIAGVIHGMGVIIVKMCMGLLCMTRFFF